MKQYLHEIIKMAETLSGKEWMTTKYGTYGVQNNHVVRKKYGHRYKLPLSEEVLNRFTMVNNTGSNDQYLINELFEDVIRMNPDLLEFADVPEKHRMDIYMGAVSWLRVNDIRFFINNYNYQTRPKWLLPLNKLAQQLEGNEIKSNEFGFLECLNFVLSPETCLEIISDNIQNATEYQKQLLKDLKGLLPRTISFDLYTSL
jgi:hypothetical protein